MIKTIIIEDEKLSREMLKDSLDEHFNDVELLAVCKNAAEGKAAIEAHHPDLVFTDIQLGKDLVFDMLAELERIDFEIIFTTSHEAFAIQAIKFSALDYIVKPFTMRDLTTAMSSYRKKHDKKQSPNEYDVLFHNLRNTKRDSKKIVLPTLNGKLVVSVSEIIRCESDVNYTYFFLVNKTKLLVRKTLKEYEELLSDYDFIRVHQSHLINLHYVKKYIRGEGGIVVMNDASEVDVSRRKKDEFLKRLEQI